MLFTNKDLRETLNLKFSVICLVDNLQHGLSNMVDNNCLTSRVIRLSISDPMHRSWWEGGIVGGGEGQSIVSPSIQQLHLQLKQGGPGSILAQVQAVHSYEPVRGGDDLGDEGDHGVVPVHHQGGRGLPLSLAYWRGKEQVQHRFSLWDPIQSFSAPSLYILL